MPCIVLSYTAFHCIAGLLHRQTAAQPDWASLQHWGSASLYNALQSQKNCIIKFITICNRYLII